MKCGPENIGKVLSVVGEKDEHGRNLKEIFSYILTDDSVRILMPNSFSLVMFVRFRGEEWDGHIIGNKEVAKKAIEWMFENEQCEKISWLPPTRALKRVARRLDKYLGSHQVGDRHVIERSALCQQ